MPSPDTLPDFEDLYRTYRTAADRLASALRGVDDERADMPGVVNGSSVRRLVLQLVDDELVATAAMRRLLGEPGGDLPDHDALAWLDGAGSAVPLDVAVALFGALRRFGAALVRELPDTAWLHNATHPRAGRITLAQHFMSRTQDAETVVGAVLAARRARGW